MSVGGDSSYISGNIDRVIKIVTMTIGCDVVTQTLRSLTMKSPLQQGFMSGDVGRNVSHVKEDMEGGEVPDEISVAAVTEVEDGVDGVLQVGARGVHGHGDGSLPPLQERLQVAEEGEVTVSSVSNGLVAIEIFTRSHVIIEDPILVSHILQ